MLLIGLVGVVAWLWLTDRLTGAGVTRLVAGVLAFTALRLGLEGSVVGGVALGLGAAGLFLSADPARRQRAAEVGRARALLGVGADAEPDVVRAAYLRLAAAAHPDRGGDVAAMQALNAARDLLLSRARTR